MYLLPYPLLSKKPIHLGKDTNDNSPTMRTASDRVVPCVFVASQVYFPACSRVTAWMYREPEPAWDVTGSGSELPGLNKWGFRDLDLRAWDGWLVINPCLSYQRMAGTGTPVALQDKVTESPTATSALAGALTIMGLSPLPIKEKIIHIQKLSTLYIVSTYAKQCKIISSYCINVNTELWRELAHRYLQHIWSLQIQNMRSQSLRLYREKGVKKYKTKQYAFRKKKKKIVGSRMQKSDHKNSGEKPVLNYSW